MVDEAGVLGHCRRRCCRRGGDLRWRLIGRLGGRGGGTFGGWHQGGGVGGDSLHDAGQTVEAGDHRAAVALHTSVWSLGEIRAAVITSSPGGLARGPAEVRHAV